MDVGTGFGVVLTPLVGDSEANGCDICPLKVAD